MEQLVPPEPEPVIPSLDESERLWRQCAGELAPMPRGMRLEDLYTAKLIERGFAREHWLTHHLQALVEAERHAEAIELARAALASGVEFPSHWYPQLVASLVALGRLDEAAREMPHVVGWLEAYNPEVLAIAMRYHAAANEPGVEAMLYHAGARWFSTWSSQFRKADAARFGPRPVDLAAQFAAWFVRWTEDTYLRASVQPRLGHFLVWMKEIDPAAFGAIHDEFVATRDRAIALRTALASSSDEASASAIIDELLPIADAEDAARACHSLRAHAPLAAYRFLIAAITAEGRRFYRDPGGERVDAVVSAMYLALDTPALRDRLEEAYAIARGYLLVDDAALHYNLACCANRLGRRTDALGHVARALALDWPDPSQLHADEDLASLRGDPAFEQIFVSDATRRAAEAVAVEEEEEDDEDDDGSDDLYDHDNP